MLFAIPFTVYSDEMIEEAYEGWDVSEAQRMISSDDPSLSGFTSISGSLQYQIRDVSGGLICIVQSNELTIYDSNITLEYLNNHQSRTLYEHNDQLINYVPIIESWTVGEGDTFLSALKHAIVDYEAKKQYSLFFATTNGCAIQPGDNVTVVWKIFYILE